MATLQPTETNNNNINVTKDAQNKDDSESKEDTLRWLLIYSSVVILGLLDLRQGIVSEIFIPEYYIINTMVKSIASVVDIFLVTYCSIMFLYQFGQYVDIHRFITSKKPKDEKKKEEKKEETKPYKFTNFVSASSASNQTFLNDDLTTDSSFRRRSSFANLGNHGNNSAAASSSRYSTLADQMPRTAFQDCPSMPLAAGHQPVACVSSSPMFTYPGGPLSSPASPQHLQHHAPFDRQQRSPAFDPSSRPLFPMSSSPAPLSAPYSPSLANYTQMAASYPASGLSPPQHSSVHQQHPHGLVTSPQAGQVAADQMTFAPGAGCSSLNTSMNQLLDKSMNNLHKVTPYKSETIGESLSMKVNTLSPVKHDQILHTSMEEMNEYITKANEMDSTNKNSMNLNGTCMYYGDNNINIAPDLKTQVYQVGKNIPKPKMAKKEESTENEIKFSESQKDSSTLDTCLDNMKMWVDRTIVKRVSTRISEINVKIKSQGKIGESTLAQLKKISIDFPVLKSLTPYLEISEDQKYLVNRINKLASGYCLNCYNWRGGDSNWDDSLPNDAQLVFHLFITYMNFQIPIFSDMKKFSDNYVTLAPAKIVKTKPLCLHMVNSTPPYIEVIDKMEKCNVDKGRNNLYYALLCFFWNIKVNHDSLIDRISISHSGLNMDWVFTEK